MKLNLEDAANLPEARRREADPAQACFVCSGTRESPRDAGVPCPNCEGRPFFTDKNIALATMTPEQEAATEQGCCPKCAQPALEEKHREAGMRWLQCDACKTVYVLEAKGRPDSGHVHESWWLVESTYAPRTLYYAGHHKHGDRLAMHMVDDPAKAVRFPDEWGAKYAVAAMHGIKVDKPPWPLDAMGYRVAEHIFDYTPRA